MPQTTLLITVGGSPQPVVTAVQTLKPDRTIFICSDGSKGSVSQVIGEGTPCEIRRGSEIVEKRPNLVTQLGLGDRFSAETDLIRLENPDDLAECYRQISTKIAELRQADPQMTLQADYTGGTKTMSLALGAAALGYGVTLYLTTSLTRENLVRVERGESTERAPTTQVTVDRVLHQLLPQFLSQYNYAAAVAQMENLLTSFELASDQKRQIRQLRDMCAGFDAWDRFDHNQAWLAIEPNMKTIQAQGLFLKKVMGSRSQIDPHFQPTASIQGHGYEIVEDLLLNADRRAAQSRYDDAVGRLYRALELLAQIRLWQAHSIQTGNVDITCLPENLRDTYAQFTAPDGKKIQLALRNSYTLLSQLPDDPLGQLYQLQADRLQDALKLRNNSLFAHGFSPIAAADYQRMEECIGQFIQTGIAALVPAEQRSQPAQFPKQLSC